MAFSMRKALAILGVAALCALAAGPEALAQKTRLTVYTAMENDQLGPYKQAFEADNPNTEIVWVRDSTGVVTARFLAEKDNPRADIIWGLAASSLALFDAQGLLEPYTPAGANALKPMFRSGKNPDPWVGMDAFLAVVCFNTAEAAKGNAPKPASWNDLTNAAYRGKVVMPHPASSGTGYLTIAAWLQLMGEEKGWQFMDKLHENIAVYTHSGSAPCV
jgi:iron(III) transport system substrate-binding protein